MKCYVLFWRALKTDACFTLSSLNLLKFFSCQLPQNLAFFLINKISYPSSPLGCDEFLHVAVYIPCISRLAASFSFSISKMVICSFCRDKNVSPVQNDYSVLYKITKTGSETCLGGYLRYTKNIKKAGMKYGQLSLPIPWSAGHPKLHVKLNRFTCCLLNI